MRAARAAVISLLGLAGLLVPQAELEAQAAATYTICNASASVGYLSHNYLERNAAGRPKTQVDPGRCDTFAADQDLYIKLVGYRSFRITSDLDASGTSASYGSCVDRSDPELSFPSRSLKYKGYAGNGCSNSVLTKTVPN